MLLTPDEIYGSLFVDVQLSGIYPDSKTFVDLEPLAEPNEIRIAYKAESMGEGFDLRGFLDRFFKTENIPSAANLNASSIGSHIEALWSVLKRPADKEVPRGSSKIPLPYDYVVPGGRFNEIYYWDSYFTMVGLVRADKADLAIGMLRNFTYLIEEFGHVPNGNRTYFLSRSQPPFYSLMFTLLASHLSEEDRSKCIAAMRKEYAYWMDGAETLNDTNRANRRVVYTNGHVVNRYYDDSPTPRQESYREDVNDAEGMQNKEAFYRHIRAACESGWDFSSRWFVDPDDITTIRTCDIVPVDLNCLLWHLETVLAETSTDDADRLYYQEKADTRAQAIQELCWNQTGHYYNDFLYTEACTTDRLTAAMVFPLFFGLATEAQAKSTAAIIQDRLIQAGGLMTTVDHTTQQWDAPNGWAPLQYMAVYGLDRYQLYDPARCIVSGWCHACEAKFTKDHKLIEKYNVTNPLHTAKGGEYPAQDGFGWTNAVYIDLMHYLDHH